MSNIMLNIVEPGSTPIDPGTGTIVPDTGLFTHGIGSSEATIIAVSTILLLAIVALVVFAILHKKKTGKSLIRNNKHITTAVILLAILASAGTFIALAKNAVNATDTDDQAEGDDSSLTVDVSSEDLTIEVGDEPVFAILPVDVTVEEATLAGYTLTASTNNTSLVSTTDSSKVIPMVATEGDELTALTTNTYGFSLVEPESKDDEVYTTLSTDPSTPTVLKATDYTETEANDATTIYYGFYITPDTPYGTYTGSTISYEAIPSLATIAYDAAGLYYNNDESFTTNTIGYKPSTPDSPIEELSGEYLTPAPLTPVDPSTTIHYTFLGWSKTEGATTPDYEDEEDIIANLTLSPNEDLTLYAVWHYNTVLSFNGNGGSTTTPMVDRTIPAGTTEPLPANTYTKTGSVFLGWNTVETPTPDNPGKSYADEASFTAPDTSADITLYAQWAYTTTITFNGNGATGGTMSPQTVVAGTPQNLTKNTFTKTNATFIGWNTVETPTPDNPGIAYEDQAEYIASTTEHKDITLYAQWAYTTIDFSGNFSEGGGSGGMSSITIAGGVTTTLPQNNYTNDNCIFTGWNTAADGNGTSYGNKSQYTAKPTTIESFTLYAQWECVTQINYHGNGATGGEMSSTVILGGNTAYFTTNAYTKDGYSFNGWNTEANPTPDNPGTSYPDHYSYTAPKTRAVTLELYAQWAGTTITFSSNGGSGTMSDVTIPAGTSANLPQNTFTRTGYAFNGWNTNASGTGTSYSDQGSYPATAGVNTTITLHAQWLPTTTITFNGNGETSGSMADQTIVAGTPQTLTPNAYAKDGYVFNGWNTVKDPTLDNPGTSYTNEQEFTADTLAHKDITLYAQWIVPVYLYNNVAAMNKGTQTLAQLQATITAPTTDDPSTDQSNSGVYEYNSSVFGEASDASNTSKIYYYRGILEQAEDQGSYGSDGKATTYPNYVKLANNTCWRIVRTTGSGGVKMVYNGTWTGSTCANKQTNAQTTSTQAFASKGTSSQSSSASWSKNIHYVGYTFNNSVTDSTTETSVDTVFGSDANPSLNNTRSNIKTYIEDTWYTSNMTAYTNLLEPAAGYCNDRTAYSDDTTTTALSTIAPYQTSSATMYFGSYGRNMNATNANKTPSLTCPRSTVDLYRYVPNSTGVSNELKYPAALLTADELSFAGSGSSTASQGSSYNTKSYLRSGNYFWLLSPYRRYSGYAGESFLFPNGPLSYDRVDSSYGVRPAISLKPGTIVTDGDGTATNPWTISE